MQPSAVIVLAAGLGTRMKSATPKVLHPLAGRSLLGHVLTAVAPLSPDTCAVVVGASRDDVRAEVARYAPDAVCVVQQEQLGTGHAVQVALAALPEVLAGPVLIVAGDTPLLRSADLAAAITAAQQSPAVVVTAHVADPTGYGRIVRAADGSVAAIVEHRDASPEQREITEVNSGMYVVDAARLRDAVSRLDTHNSQGEMYLTDIVASLTRDGVPVVACQVAAQAILGANDRAQLADLAALMRDRLVRELMLDGATIVDPKSVWIDCDVTVEPDAVILPNVQLLGSTSVASGASVGPDCTLTDTSVGSGASVVRTTAVGAVIGPAASVGPYTYLRPGTVLLDGAKAGGFVEIKNSEVGRDAKVPHLSYVGDATIGEGSNIGAATVVVNYDGVAKHHTTIGRHVRIGSDTMLVAPVVVGDGAYTAAGSVITDDVPPGAMGVARARQRNILDWVLRRRPGSASAHAAVADSAPDADRGHG